MIRARYWREGSTSPNEVQETSTVYYPIEADRWGRISVYGSGYKRPMLLSMFKPRTGLVMEEQYLGGFESGGMKKTGVRGGLRTSCNGQADNWCEEQKSFGHRASRAGVGGVAGVHVGMKLSRDESVKMIQDLEEKNDFDVTRDNVSRPEFKKPSFWARGHIVVTPRTGEGPWPSTPC